MRLHQGTATAAGRHVIEIRTSNFSESITELHACKQAVKASKQFLVVETVVLLCDVWFVEFNVMPHRVLTCWCHVKDNKLCASSEGH